MDYLEVYQERPSTQSAMLPEMGFKWLKPCMGCMYGLADRGMDMLTQSQEWRDESIPAGQVASFSPVGLYFIS